VSRSRAVLVTGFCTPLDRDLLHRRGQSSEQLWTYLKSTAYDITNISLAVCYSSVLSLVSHLAMAGSNARKVPTPSRTPSTKRNSSILSFFQKTDNPQGAKSTQLRMSHFLTASPSSGRTPSLQRGDSSKSDTNGGLFLEDKK